MTHSPTPWREIPGSRDSEFNYIAGGKNTIICEIDITHPEQKANASFIVTAVNAYAKDQEIIGELAKVLYRVHVRFDGCANRPDECATCSLLDRSRGIASVTDSRTHDHGGAL